MHFSISRLPYKLSNKMQPYEARYQISRAAARIYMHHYYAPVGRPDAGFASS